MVLNVIQKELTYANTTATLIGYLPPNAYVSQIRVLVETAFNDGDGCVIDIGTSSTANYFANDVSVTSTGVATVTEAKSGVVVSTTDPTAVYAIVVNSGSVSTAGKCKVCISYAFNE